MDMPEGSPSTVQSPWFDVSLRQGDTSISTVKVRFQTCSGHATRSVAVHRWVKHICSNQTASRRSRIGRSMAYSFAKNWTGRARWEYYGYDKDSNASYQDLYVARDFHTNLITLFFNDGKEAPVCPANLAQRALNARSLIWTVIERNS
jgi:hypothetical protein